MAFVFKRLALVASIAAAILANKAPAAPKDEPKFQAAPAASYPAHQTNDKVTVAADVFVMADKAKPAFGKHNPYQYGVLPVLVIIQNDTGKTLRLENLKVEYVAGRERVAATPASEVKYIQGPSRPEMIPGPGSRMPKIRKTKNPLTGWEIEGRAFAARMLPPGQSASGFFYFQTGFQHSASLYLTGIREADTGKELFYYEIPLAEADR